MVLVFHTQYNVVAITPQMLGFILQSQRVIHRNLKPGLSMKTGPNQVRHLQVAVGMPR